jgi:tetratricopeptide (TPR) repeat protein
VQLQLSLGRAGIGLELSGGLALSGARLAAARARLLGLSFPLDVSGGVERFRHRRSTLVLAEVELPIAAIERWLGGLATDLLARAATTARLVPIEDLLFRVELAAEGAALTFEIAFGALGAGVVGHAHGFRGALPVEKRNAGPVALVGRLLQRVANALGGEARGMRLHLADPLKGAALAAFVARGARLPLRRDVALTAVDHDVELVRARFGEADEGSTARPHVRFASLEELDRWVGAADDAMVRGELPRARELYAEALERAPRHKSILLRLAEVDASADRVDAALSWVRDAEWTRTTTGPALELARTLRLADLWSRRGAHGRARANYERAGHAAIELGELRLGARALAIGATHASDDDPQLGAMLDRAIAADPFDAAARTRRARLRIVRGEDDRAVEDLQHLEAMARGREARRALLQRVGETWRELGRPARAIAAFERALRYAPDDPATLAGLGLSLVAAGEHAHGTTLLARAIALSGTGPDGDPQRTATLLALARALADRLEDALAAIARLKEIPTSHRRGAVARALEGAFRARLGDLAGATRAFADAAEATARGVDPEDVREVVGRLCEGAETLRDAGDRLGAHPLAVAAAFLDPRDPRARALATALAGERREVEDAHAHAHADGYAHENAHDHDREETPIAAPVTETLDEGALERRAESLLARVKGDPNDDRAVDELASILGALGRDLELFALLAARYDDADDAERARIGPRQRAVLERLADAAEARGADLEAGLFRDAAAARG